MNANDIREQIVEIRQKHPRWECLGDKNLCLRFIECGCGDMFRGDDEYELHIADELVRELGLTVEIRRLSDGYGGMTWDADGHPVQTPSKPCTPQYRYVTSWTPA